MRGHYHLDYQSTKIVGNEDDCALFILIQICALAEGHRPLWMRSRFEIHSLAHPAPLKLLIHVGGESPVALSTPA